MTLRSEPAFVYDANHTFLSQLLCLIFDRAICFLNSYLSAMLQSKFDRTAEAVLPTLIDLIPNSAKVLPHCRIDKNWQADGTVLQGCGTELARLHYSFGKVA